jgi:hypothetical protein
MHCMTANMKKMSSAALAVTICVCLGSWPMGYADSLHADEPNSLLTNHARRYADGPLTAADFLAETKPDDSTLEVDPRAYCATEVRWEYRYGQSTRDRVITLRLERIDIYALVLRNESWNVRKDDKVLLDHEQGHFDLTHLHALRAQRHFAKLLQSGRAPESKGRTEQQAVQILEQQIRSEIEPFLTQAKLAHRRYDEATRHGELGGPQAEQRRQQLDAIRAVVEDLKAVADLVD